MGIITKSIQSFTTKDAGRGFRNPPLYPKKNLELLDLKKGWVYTCMNIRATELANSVYEFYDKGKEILNEGHWIYMLKENPNPYYTWFDMMQLISYWLDLDGNCYILPKMITKGGVTFPVSFTVLPSNRVQIYEVGGELQKYRVAFANNKSFLIDAEDIIHIKDMSPSKILQENYLQGSASTLLSIKDVQEIYVKRLDYIESYYEGDGVMPFILTSSNDELGQEEANLILEAYKSKISNPKYRPQAMLTGGVEPKLLSESQSGQGAITSEDSESMRIQIGAAFGIADTYLTGKYNGKAAAYDTIQVMNEKTTDPRASKVAYYFNQFLSRLNNNVRFKHVPKTFRSEEFLLRQSVALYNIGAIDVDEVREANGYEPLGLVRIDSEKKTLNRNRTLSTGIG